MPLGFQELAHVSCYILILLINISNMEKNAHIQCIWKGNKKGIRGKTNELYIYILIYLKKLYFIFILILIELINKSV